MRKVITSRDIEALQTTGGDLASLPVDALYTPSAKDALNALGITPAGKTSVGASPSSEPTQPPAERQVTNALLSTILPPFSRLQHLNQSDLKNQSGMIGVVASITSKSVTFSPVAETGVITSFDLASATLSILNSNSGILEEKKFPLESVALHKDRFLYFLGNVKLVRGTVGRICTVLSIKFIRELLICLIYYAKLHQIDVLSAWPIKSDELIQLFKYTYVTYCNNLILKPWKHNHVTLVSCLFRILKENFKQIVWTSSHGNDLLSSLTAGLWTGSSVTLSHPCVPHLSQLFRSSSFLCFLFFRFGSGSSRIRSNRVFFRISHRLASSQQNAR